MKRFSTPLVAVIVSFALAGAAFAAFVGFGTTSGTGSVASLSSITISSATVTPSSALLPGATSDATFELNNPNSVAVTIVAVSQNGDISVSGGSDCNATNAHVSFSDQSSLSIVVPAGATNYAVDLPAALSMTSDAASGCQAATFNVPIFVTVHTS